MPPDVDTGVDASESVRVRYVDADPETRDRVVAAFDEADDVVVAGDDGAAGVYDHLDELDCLVCSTAIDGTDWSDVVSVVSDRRPDLPVVLYATDGSEATATAALRAGVADYVPGGEGPGALVDRVRAAVGAAERDAATGDGRLRELRDNERTLQALYRVATDLDRPFADRVRGMLDLGRERLGVANAFLARVDVDESEWRVLESVGDTDLIGTDMRTDLENTYCRKAVESDGLLGVHDAESTGYGDHPADTDLDVACYLGGKVVVDGDLYGTVCFADRTGREPFSDPERTFVEILVTWLGYEIERSETERRLRVARDRYENTLERIDDAFLAVDEDWRITYVNEAGAAVLREAMGESYDREAMVGRHLWEEVPEAVDTTFYERYHEALETRESVTFEERYEPLDVWFEVRAHPDEDGLSVFFEDVTERKERERELERYATIVETVQDGIYVLDEDRTYVFVNQALAEMTGYDRAEIVGSPAPMLTSGPTTREADRRQRSMAETDDEVGVIETEVETASGESIPVENRFTSFSPDGEGSGRVGVVRDVSERKERERELEHYERVLETVRGMVFAVEESGRFSVVTEPLADFLGYDRSAVIGRPASEVLSERVLDAGQEAIDLLLESDTGSTTFDAEVEDAEGGTVPIEVEMSALTDDDGSFRGAVGVVYDRSDLAAARRRLERERHRFSYLFESLPDPVAECGFVDGEPVVRSVNDAFRETFCPGEREVVGRSINDIVRPAGDADHEPGTLDERIRAGESVTTELRRETVGGPRDFLFRGVPYEGSEEYPDDPRVFAIYTDITEQKRYERRLEVLHRILRHNLRNRTTAIRGYAGRIASAVEDPDLGEAVDRLQENTDVLASLNEKAQAIERAASPTAGGEGPVDAAELARTIVDGYDGRAGVTVESDLPERCPVAADDRLATAIENLVENAVEYGDGLVRVSIGPSDRGDDWAAIRVADDGPGIPETERAVVSGDRDITQLDHGSGLGLWLVRWVLEAVGGEIEFEDAEGTTVVLHVRRAA